MKRIVYLLILFIMFVPTIVLADSSSPSILGYDAVVINKKGVKVEDYDKKYTIAYNTKVHVYGEYGNEASCEIINKKAGDPEYFINIPLKDLAPVKKEIFPNDLQKANNQGTTLEKAKDEFIVINSKGVKLSKGPAEIYGKYDKLIPYETKLHTTHYIDGTSSIWFYVDDGEYKGWLDMSEDDYGVLVKNDFLTFNKAELKDKDGKVITVVPAEEEFKEIYIGNKRFYLKYQDNSGYIDKSEKFDLGYKSKKGNILTLVKTNIVSIDGEIRGTIPQGEIIKILYAESDDEFGDYEYHSTTSISIGNKSYYYVEYEGIKGFINSDDVTSLYYEYKIKTVELKEEKDFYEIKMFNEEIKENETCDEFLKRFKRVERIPKRATITYYDIKELYDDKTKKDIKIELVKYKGKLGCVVTVSEREEESEPSPLPSINPTVTPKNSYVKAEEKNNNIILYSIIGGVLLTLTALGTIIALNKKRKIKKEKKK